VTAPEFWRRRGIRARLLQPFSLITQAVTARRMRKTGFDPRIPVVCVGNAGVGGAGKTIVVMDVLHRMSGRPFALTRGYGGTTKGPMLVEPEFCAAEQVGDEALLLASAAPTVVARDRAAGARLALAEGATAVVMDDGLQNAGLKKTVSLLVIDGGYGFGNGLLLPAGPLREPVMAAAARCHAAILIGDDETGALKQLPPSLPVLRAHLIADCGEKLGRRRVIAFAGIGRPEKFFRSVLSLGADIVDQHAYPDHHVYTTQDVNLLLDAASNQGAVLVTTAKDYVKLPAGLRAMTLVITVRLFWDDEVALKLLLP
jgi:tetraacyldisaccharide 4'-kinase